MVSSARLTSLHGESFAFRLILCKRKVLIANFTFRSDLSTYTWSELPCKGTAPSPRYFHSCCIHGNKLYTYGGYSGSERLADMFAYGEICRPYYVTNEFVRKCVSK